MSKNKKSRNKVNNSGINLEALKAFLFGSASLDELNLSDKYNIKLALDLKEATIKILKRQKASLLDSIKELKDSDYQKAKKELLNINASLKKVHELDTTYLKEEECALMLREITIKVFL